MGGRGRPTRILCINCNICVNTLHRYQALELDTRVTALLCSWVYPQIQEASRSDEPQAGPSHYGHTNVCLLCGCSTLRRQSDKILRDNPSELQQSMINIIESRIAPRQIAISDRVSHPCWLRTQREVRPMTQIDDTRPLPSSSNISIEEGTALPQENLQPEAIQRIVLPDYRRAANSNNHCVFPDCNSTTLNCVLDKLHAIILHNHHSFVLNLARVCAEHLRSTQPMIIIKSHHISKKQYFV